MSRKAGPRVDRIALFESHTLYVLVGHLRNTERHRILIVRRATPVGATSTVRELEHDTNQDDLLATLKALEREYGGATLAHRLDAVAFLGMVRFLEGYHMLFITRREPVGVILGHTVFRVEETAMISVSEGPGSVAPTAASSAAGTSSSAAATSAAAELPEESEADHLEDDASAARGQTTFGGLGRFLQSSLSGIFSRSHDGGRWDDGWAEKRYKSLFQSMDLTRDFYFSYTYDLTNTLQTNQLGSPDSTAAASSPSSAKSTPAAATAATTPSPSGSPGPASSADGTPPLGPAVPPLRGKYVWNHHLMVHLLPELRDGAWLTPLVHGFFMQSTLSLCGRLIAITLIARRSRLFAGARLLKRGLCASGHTANEVETEQIVADSARGALHLSRISSAVQLRGSIPLVWGHGDLKVIVPRPDISIQTADPTYDATLRHFEGLWQEYGGPVLVFDLVRQVERRPRELLLGQALSAAVAELNRRLEREGHAHAGHLRHIPYDFKKESKRKGSDVFDAIERLAEHFLARTGFFCSAPTHPRAQGTLPLPLSTAEAEAIRRLLGAVDGEHDGGGAGAAGTAAGASPATTRASLLEQCASSGSTGSLRRWDASRALPATDSGRSSRAEAAPAHDDEEEAEEDEEEGEEEQQTWLALQLSDESGVTARSTRSLTRSWTRRPANWRAGVAPLSSSDATSVHTEQLSGGSTTWKQSGVVRTNCIDCLDRTNVAQFCIGRCLLKRQLFALGLAPASESIEAANTALMAMYEEQGTVLALQYAGSQALHATNSNAAKDFLQSAKRFYRNTFTDMEKQQIMDVFLGVFTPRRGHPNIWEIDSDLFLHNRPPPALHAPLRPRQPTLEPEEVEPPTRQQQRESQSRGTSARPHDLFDDYYPPTVLTSFDEVLSRPFAAPMKFRQTSQAASKAPASHPLPDTSSAIAASVVGSGNQGDGAAEATLDPESTLLEDVKLAAIGDLPVMLPSGYSQVDEWDRRRRTSLQTSRLAERYVSLYRQQADKQVYKRYVEIGRLEPVSTSSGGDANVPTAFTSV